MSGPRRKSLRRGQCFRGTLLRQPVLSSGMLRTFWTILGSGKQGVIEDVGVVKQQALPLCPRSGRSRMQRRPGAMALKAVSIPLTSKNKHYSASLTKGHVKE